MIKKIVKSTIKKVNAKKTWPCFISPSLVIDEFAHHSTFIKWSLKRILLPLTAFYIITGFLVGEHVLGSLVMAIIIFLYANFLPDLDAFFVYDHNQKNKTSAIKKRFALFFAPLVIYYILSGKQKPLDLGKYKPFHNTRAMLEFTLFLFVLGTILYFSLLKAFFFALFGFCGYFIHLIIDEKIKLIKIKK